MISQPFCLGAKSAKKNVETGLLFLSIFLPKALDCYLLSSYIVIIFSYHIDSAKSVVLIAPHWTHEKFEERLRHLFPECIRSKLTGQGRMGLLVQGSLSILFSPDFFPLSPSTAHLGTTVSTRVLYSLFQKYQERSLPFRLSTVPASSAPPIGHARLPRQPMNVSGLTALDTREYSAREYRFRNTPALRTVSEIPRLKGGNYSKARVCV